MKSVHAMIKMLNTSANVSNFETDAKEMFFSSYEKLHSHSLIKGLVEEGMSIISRMLKNGWDNEMTHCSILMLNEEYGNSLYQKVALVSLSQALEKKYFSLAA